MSLDGDAAIEGWVRVVRVHMDALGQTLEDALSGVPAELRERVRARWQEDNDQPIRPARQLSALGGPRPWFAAWDSAQGYHWRRLRRYLLDRRGRSEVEIASLDDLSNRVLSHLEDPRPEGAAAYQVRGLVLGYIQSGKTANISALISKAADVGYRFVVVLTGMDDGLRKQTQDRLGLELGLVDDPEGVGIPQASERWVTVTTGELRGGDFNPGAVQSETVLQGQERVIAVVKKNGKVLRRLIAWVGGAHPQLPVLVIDDEADQASVNTGGNRPTDGSDDDENPSTINGLIRDLLSRFDRVSYVAYTATPFANVLIDPEAFDREVERDLYPRDFIIALPRPPRYVGAERLFGRDALGAEDGPVAGLDVIEPIPPGDVGALLPPPRGAVGFVPRMCVSLHSALVDFVLATAGKINREGQGDARATMLIHTSARTAIQNSMRGLIQEEMDHLRQAWRYDQETVRAEFERRWDQDFRPVTVSLNAALDRSFAQVEPHIGTFFRWRTAVRVLNHSTEDVLDYGANPTLKVIVIGGNRLARGLTLEDLVVSYYARAAANYDTLLQMGRWFGYREAYVDLTRLWTTAELADRFRALALVEEELRDEIAVYERLRITPLDFAPRIRTHPAMAVTAANKLGSARPVQLSFQGELLQTTRFKLEERDWLEANLAAARRFLSGLGRPDDGDATRPGWLAVPWERVSAFLDEYQSYQDPTSFDAKTLRDYVRRQAEEGELVRWRVSVRGLPTPDDVVGREDLGIEGWGAVNTISRSRLKSDRSSIGVLTSPARPTGAIRQGDEEVGLSDEQIAAARRSFEQGAFPRLGMALRAERSTREGLLLVYPVSRNSRPQRTAGASNREPLFDDPQRGATVLGVAIAFPRSDSRATAQYLAGAAGRPQLEDDDPE